MDLNTEIKKKADEAEQIILGYMPGHTEATEYIKPLIDAMNYSVASGGKRLRPLIMLETYRIFAGREADIAIVTPFMAALGMIHSFSLVHDDMPEIDNDTLRRGRPTVWKKYGQYLALLDGDALLNYAYETAFTALYRAEADKYDRVFRALSYLSHKSGIYGMIGGESADVIFEKEGYDKPDKRALLEYIHRKKTAALLQAAFVIGGILGGADSLSADRLEKAALCIGLAFQIRDDILDVIGDEEKLGKNIGSDEEKNKLTYVSVTGLEASKEEAAHLYERAVEEIEKLEGDTEFLKGLMAFLVDREY